MRNVWMQTLHTGCDTNFGTKTQEKLIHEIKFRQDAVKVHIGTCESPPSPSLEKSSLLNR